MEKIKSFVYLDINKMYSISSQIFAGLTEYILSEKGEESESTESQKGPVGSGRILGDIITKGTKIQEKKFLHDYSYTLFEEELFNQEKVLLVDSSNYSEQSNKLRDSTFVKVKGKLMFKDVKLLTDTISRFNDLGEAIAYVTNFSNIQSIKEGASQISDSTRDRERKNKVKQYAKSSSNAKKIAKESGLMQDADYLKYLSNILKFGYNDLFEVVISFDEKVYFSAILHRDSIKENENTLIKKYSRNTEKEFTIFGAITQLEKKITGNLTQEITTDIDSNMKLAVMRLVDSFANVEDTFVGRLNNEIVIDPIAVYQEL